MRVKSYANVDALFCKRTILLVHEYEVLHRIVGDNQVDPAVAVDVNRRESQRFAERFACRRVFDLDASGGRDIFEGDFDVIVCDGFVGNIVLKSSEGLAKTITELMKREAKASISTTIGGALMYPVVKAIK